MKKFLIAAVSLLFAVGAYAQSGYPYSPVPFTSVKVHDNFWSQRLEASRNVTIPLAFSKCEETGRYKNFDNAARYMQTGDTATVGGLSFDDTDVYKTIEGASYLLQTYDDPKLKAYIDSVLVIVAAAQEPDGYLNTARTQNPQNPHYWMGEKRWIFDEDLSHELYNLGHMVEGAVAHYTATGKRNFLDIAIRYADCVCREIGDGEGKVTVVPGHQIAEMALSKLYVCTGDKKYLDMAKFFIDHRGEKRLDNEYSRYSTLKLQQKWENDFGLMSMPDNLWEYVNEDGSWNMAKVEPQKKAAEERMAAMMKNMPENGNRPRRMNFNRKRYSDEQISSSLEYCQSHEMIVDQKEAVGHAVRAGYMYTGIADVAALTGEKKYIDAIDTIWENVVGKKMYITGGIGSTNSGEAFGKNYQLPNMTAYCETCAAISNVYWNFRLFLLHGESKYIDVMERALYNGLISGISLDGGGFFYPNPLESMGQHERRAWFGCACCPSNVCRFIPSLPGYIYASHDNDVYVNLFVGGDATIKLAKRTVKLTQTTNYPWNGDIDIDVKTAGKYGIKVRIPGWVQNEVVPSDLYKYADKKRPGYYVAVNGQILDAELENGYMSIQRTWKKGDKITVHFDMTPRLVRAHESVEADKGRVAIENGPVVYCAEWPDNPGFSVRNVLLNQKPKFQVEYSEGHIKAGGNEYGMNIIKTTGQTIAYDKEGNLQADVKQLTLIPYYAWAHRGRGEMLVWFPQDLSAVTATPAPTIASTSKITASVQNALSAVNDGTVPRGQRDGGTSYCRWSDGEGGGTEWIAYEFEQPEEVSSCTLYWHDDQPWGQCATPKAWRVYYKNDKGEWTAVENPSEYPTEMRVACTVYFKSVKTSGLKLEIDQQDGKFAGIYEWTVE